MKTNSTNNRNFISTFARVTVVFLMVFAVASSKSVSSQNDGLIAENTTARNYSEYDMAGTYDLIATEKMALSPELTVSISKDGNYYIMSTVNVNKTNYKVGYLGQLSAPKISNSSIDIQINLDEAIETHAPVNPHTALMFSALNSIK